MGPGNSRRLWEFWEIMGILEDFREILCDYGDSGRSCVNMGILGEWEFWEFLGILKDAAGGGQCKKIIQSEQT